MQNQKALREYLREEIFPRLAPPPYGEITVHRLSSHKPVFLFVESQKNLLAVGKSFQYDHIPLESAWHCADKEFFNLKLLRDQFGMNGDSCEVIAPLGVKKELSALLVTQKASGRLLDHYIARAIYEQRRDRLFQKLSCLARFFARLHGNSRTGIPLTPRHARDYLDKLLESLQHSLLRYSDTRVLEKLAAHWLSTPEIFQGDTEVAIHGDATPTNFFFFHGKAIGIDLENMRYDDRCWDLGFIAAELKHHFWWRSGNKWDAEPFIGHFLWEYAGDLGGLSFHWITRKLPLFMALGLLRIARNSWLREDYRRVLVQEAGLCLRSMP